MVTNVLTRKSLHVASLMVKKWELLEKFRNLNPSATFQPDRLSLNQLRVENDLRKQILDEQGKDQLLQNV